MVERREAGLADRGRPRQDQVVYIGSQDWHASQGGWTFYFSQPPVGTAYVMRGIVELSWRNKARASRRKHKRARWSC